MREPWREVGFELAGELVRDASRDAALRETVLPLSKIWRRRSGILMMRWGKKGSLKKDGVSWGNPVRELSRKEQAKVCF